MRMLRCINGNTIKYRIQNKEILFMMGVIPVDGKMKERHLK